MEQSGIVRFYLVTVPFYTERPLHDDSDAHDECQLENKEGNSQGDITNSSSTHCTGCRDHFRLYGFLLSAPQLSGLAPTTWKYLLTPTKSETSGVRDSRMGGKEKTDEERGTKGNIDIC